MEKCHTVKQLYKDSSKISLAANIVSMNSTVPLKYLLIGFILYVPLKMSTRYMLDEIAVIILQISYRHFDMLQVYIIK